MSSSIIPRNLATASIVIRVPTRTQTFSTDIIHSRWLISGHDPDRFVFSDRWCLQYDPINNRVPRSVTRSKRDVVMYCSVPPPDPDGQIPSPGIPVPGAWQAWLMGALLSIGLPFLTNKWGPLVGWIDKMKGTLQTAENVAETVEEMAEKVEKIAEDISDDFPEGKLRNALNTIENAAEKIAKDADRIDNLIDKVQEMEEKMEDMIEEGNEDTKANNQT